MHFLSLKQMQDSCLAVFRRFPLSSAFVLLGSFFAIGSLYAAYEVVEVLIAGLMAAAVGYVGALALEQFLEVKGGVKGGNLYRAALVVAMMLLGWYFHGFFEWGNDDVNTMRFLSFFVIALVAYGLSPLVGAKDKEGVFWRHGMFFVVRAVKAFLLFGGLFLGFLLMVEMARQVLDTNWRFAENLGIILFILFVGVFGQTYFLAGVPKNLQKIEDKDFHRPAVMFLANYVVWPFLVVFMVLAYLLLFKGVLAWDFPSMRSMEWIYLFGILGSLGHFLIYGLKVEKGYLKFFGKYFYAFLLPLMVYFVIPVWEERFYTVGYYDLGDHFYLIVGLFLAVSALFMTVFRKRLSAVLWIVLWFVLMVNVGPLSIDSAVENSDNYYYDNDYYL